MYHLTASQVLITCSHQIPPAPWRHFCGAAGLRGVAQKDPRHEAQLRSSPLSYGAAIVVRREQPPQLNTHWGRVGVSILEQKETRIYCQQEPLQLCRGRGAHYPSIYFSVTASLALKVAGRLEPIWAASGSRLGFTMDASTVFKGHLERHSPTVQWEFPVSILCMSVHWGRWRSWREATRTQKQQKGPGWESNPQPCGREMTVLTAALLCHPGSY